LFNTGCFFAQSELKELYLLQLQVDQLYLQQKTDSAIAISKKGLELALVNNDSSNIVHFNYMLSKLYRLNKDVDSAIDCLIGGNLYIHNKEDRVKISKQLGEILMDMGAYNTAIPYLEKLVKNETQLTQKFYNINLLGKAYLNVNKISKAIGVFTDQHAIANKLNEDHFRANAANNIGYAMYIDSNFNKAQFYYQKAIEIIENKTVKSWQDSSILINVYQNYSDLTYALHHPEKAIICFERSLEYQPKWKISPSLSVEEFKTYLASLIETKQFNTVNTIIHILEKSQKTLQDKHTLLLAKINYFNATRQFNLSKEEFKNFIRINQQITRTNLGKRSQNADLIGKFYLNTASQEDQITMTQKAVMIQKQQNKINFYFYLIIFILLLSGTGFWVYQIKQKKIQTEQKLIEKEKENLKISLQLKQKDISNIAIDISQRNKEIDLFIRKFKGVEFDKPEEVKIRLLSELKILKNAISSKSSLNQFIENNELVNSEFYAKLRKLHPYLTQYEIELCSYFMIGFSTQDIANIRGISTQSVRMNKMRLKKKLKINKELQFYLRNL
jgi:tetratricopeptide (TPR) repeat protein